MQLQDNKKKQDTGKHAGRLNKRIQDQEMRYMTMSHEIKEKMKRRKKTCCLISIALRAPRGSLVAASRARRHENGDERTEPGD